VGVKVLTNVLNCTSNEVESPSIVIVSQETCKTLDNSCNS